VIHLRHATALSALTAIAIAPRVAHATDMSGLAVIVVGMFVGVPAVVLLLVGVLVAAAASAGTTRSAWHATYGKVLTVVAPFLALAYPLAMIAMDSKFDFVAMALILDAPALVLAVIALVLSRRLVTVTGR